MGWLLTKSGLSRKACMAFALLFAILETYCILYAVWVKVYGVRAEAYIIAYEERVVLGDTFDYPVVEYLAADGVKVRAALTRGAKPGAKAIGTQYTLYYDARNPGEIMWIGEYQSVVNRVIVLLIPTALFSVMALRSRNTIGPAKELQSGSS